MFIDRRRPFGEIDIPDEAVPEIAKEHIAFVERDLGRIATVSAPTFEADSERLASEQGADFLLSANPATVLRHKKFVMITIDETYPNGSERAVCYESFIRTASATICRYETCAYEDGQYAIARYDLDALRIVTPAVFPLLPEEERENVLTKEYELGINGLRFPFDEITLLAEDAADIPLIRSM